MEEVNSNTAFTSPADPELKSAVRRLASQLAPEIRAIREHLHTWPELSFEEQATHDYIAQTLRAWGIDHTPGVAGTGLVAYIRGKNPDRYSLALRSDHDALPIHEANEAPYRSRNAGVMHACGHDGHTAAHLGAVKILHELREHFDGTVKCIFQLGEERYPSGARQMIEAGVLADPAPAAIFGTHVQPGLPVGKVGLRAGNYMSSADEITLTVQGRGGHAAVPHLAVDAVVIAAQIIVALQTVVSRSIDSTVAAVLSFGRIETPGGAYNVLPDQVKIVGGLRTLDENWKSLAHERIRIIAEQTALALGGYCTVQIVPVTPVLHNDEALTARARTAMIELLGAENVVDLPIWMASEDFAYYTQRIPGCFYRLGIWNAETGLGEAPLHTPNFDLDPAALETGMAVMAWLALCELGRLRV